MVHSRAKQRKSGAEERTHEGVSTDGAVGGEHVDVDDVVEALHEDHVHAHGHGDTADDLARPVGVRVGGPAENESTLR